MGHRARIDPWNRLLTIMTKTCWYTSKPSACFLSLYTVRHQVGILVGGEREMTQRVLCPRDVADKQTRDILTAWLNSGVGGKTCAAVQVKSQSSKIRVAEPQIRFVTFYLPRFILSSPVLIMVLVMIKPQLDARRFVNQWPPQRFKNARNQNAPCL